MMLPVGRRTKIDPADGKFALDHLSKCNPQPSGSPRNSQPPVRWIYPARYGYAYGVDSPSPAFGRACDFSHQSRRGSRRGARARRRRLDFACCDPACALIDKRGYDPGLAQLDCQSQRRHRRGGGAGFRLFQWILQIAITFRVLTAACAAAIIHFLTKYTFSVETSRCTSSDSSRSLYA